MPVITEADIEDRSKGDVISKCVAILQLVWFVIQLIARYTQDLPITLLEIDTLGVVALACIAYIFWWKKPKDIGRPYIVHWNSRTTAPPPRGSLTNKYQYVINIFGRACSDLPAFKFR
jgi:predicted Rdx family selenoprotein